MSEPEFDPSSLKLSWRHGPPRSVEAILRQRMAEIVLWAEGNGAGWTIDILKTRANRVLAIAGGVPDFPALRARFGLTPAEMHVLQGVLEGRSLRDMARGRDVTFHTVRTHYANLRSKLGARDRAEVVRLCLTPADLSE